MIQIEEMEKLVKDAVMTHPLLFETMDNVTGLSQALTSTFERWVEDLHNNINPDSDEFITIGKALDQLEKSTEWIKEYVSVAKLDEANQFGINMDATIKSYRSIYATFTKIMELGDM